MPIPDGRETRVSRPRRPGLLGNPRSGRFARRPEALREAAARFPGGLYREGRDPPEIGRAVRELVSAGADIIIVMGGDGTLQCVLDHLHGALGSGLPPLAVVPCGTTNMTALDLGHGQAPLRVLERLRRSLLADRDLPVVIRPVLRIRRPAVPPLYGMFFGTGIIAAGVRYFRDRVRGRALIGEAASGIAILRMLYRLLAGTESADLVPVRAGIAENGGRTADGAFLLILASTLERLLLGMRPYWGRQHAPMHYTAIRERPKALWRSLPLIASGRGHGLDDRYFHSRNLQTLELAFTGDFVLDGEIHAVAEGEAGLRIDTGGPIRFAVP